MFERTGTRTDGECSGVFEDLWLSFSLGGQRVALDASAEAVGLGFFYCNRPISSLSYRYAAIGYEFIDIGKRKLYD